MTTTLPARDARLSWHGAIAVQHEPDWSMPWRLPFRDLDLYPPEALHTAAARASGVRLAFATDAPSVAFITAPLEASEVYDLYADGKPAGSLAVDAGCTRLAFDRLPAGTKTLELWLSPRAPFRLAAVELPSGSTLDRAHDLRPRWVAYGSSITQCAAAGSTSTTWPGVAARARGLHLTSLGYGGQCHMDPMLARLIRDLPADLISLKLGINIMGGATMNVRAFKPAVLGTIAAIRDRHPDTPMVVCSPIWCRSREATSNAAGMTLEIMRAEIRAAVESFQRRGDRQLFYVDGRRLFGEDLEHLLSDGLHPTAEGYRKLGENFAREVFEVDGVRIRPSGTA